MVELARIGILAAYAAATGAFLYASSGGDLEIGDLPLFLGFWLLTVSPVAVLCLTRWHPKALALAALPVAAFGVWAYYDTLYVAELDPQSAIVFVIAPILQFGMVAAVIALVAIGAQVMKARK